MDAPREKCTATNREGERCRRWPAPGATVCRAHGAAAPQVKQAAAERIIDQQARKALAGIGAFDPVENPLTELSLMAGRARQWMRVLEEHVADLEKMRRVNANGGEEIRAEILLYERSMDRTAKMLESLARLDIDTRLAAITERQAEKVIAAIEAALAAAGITDNDAKNAARAAAGRHLSAA